MKIGIDIHGVIDSDPMFFSKLTKSLRDAGNEVHILTGVEDGFEVRESLKDLDITYTHFFSITTHHKTIGTNIKYIDGNPRHPLIQSDRWDKTKADYCLKNGIDIMIDDSIMYEMYFDKIYTQYLRWDSALTVLLTTILKLDR